MTSAYAYIRISGPDQRNGDGPERQRLAIRQYASANGYRVAKVYEEQVTGTTETRSEFAAMIEAMDETKVVIVEKLDRLGRDIMVSEALLRQIQKRGGQLVSTMEPDLCSAEPSRKFIRHVLAAVAEMDRDLIVHRTRAARERIRSRGERCEGVKPFGELEGEADTLDVIRSLAGENYSAITRALNERGVPTRNGRPWQVSTVRGIVRRLR